MIPNTMKAPRQLVIAINPATSGGVKAAPNRELEWVIPCANPRLPAGIQSDIARVAIGKVAPSPNPSMTRANRIAANVLTRPVSRVAVPQITADRVNAFRAPNRSLNHPPKTVKIK
jgi:hypothetical protein